MNYKIKERSVGPMSKDKLDEIEKKKMELQSELDRIQDELDYSIDEVRTEVSSKFRPSEIFRKYPLPVIGASILLGFLAGHKKSKSGRSRAKLSNGGAFRSTIWNEFKRVASRKAISLATDYIDNALGNKREHPSTITNGSVDTEE